MNTGAAAKYPTETEAGADTITRYIVQSGTAEPMFEELLKAAVSHRQRLPSGRLIVSVRHVPKDRRLTEAQRGEIIADIEFLHKVDKLLASAEALHSGYLGAPPDPRPVYVLFGSDISPREFGFVYEYGAYPLDKPAGLDAALDAKDLDRAEALAFPRSPGFAAMLEEANSLEPPHVAEAKEVQEGDAHLAAFFGGDRTVDENTRRRWQEAIRTPAEF